MPRQWVSAVCSLRMLCQGVRRAYWGAASASTEAVRVLSTERGCMARPLSGILCIGGLRFDTIPSPGQMQCGRVLGSNDSSSREDSTGRE